MKPVPQDTVDRLDLSGALERELEAKQNLLPDTPGLDGLSDQANEFCAWLGAMLRRGIDVAPVHVVSARKVGFGTRPVAIAGIPERVVYRALVDDILRDHPPLDRSPEAYLAFLSAPADYAHEQGGGGMGWLIGQSGISHVVKTDVTAFYQYVDHSILARELLAITSNFDAIDALGELLQAMEGRTFGIPQLLDPSDALSDVYAEVIERAMIRDGFPTWRFNDDFRVACASYSEALRAIEALGRHAREVGLVISEHKTFTPTFLRYAFDTLGLTVVDTMPEGDAPDIEDMVEEYTEGDLEGQLQDALDVIARVQSPNGQLQPNAINLGSLDLDDHRRIRRAIRVLTRGADPGAVDKAISLAIYVPSLTPHLANYLKSLEGELVAPVIEQLAAHVSLSDWQAMWFVNTVRHLGLLDSQDAQARVAWVRNHTLGPRDHALKAEASLALAHSALIGFDELEYGLRVEPEPLQPWYIAAIMALASAPDPPRRERLLAARRSNPLFRFMTAEM